MADRHQACEIAKVNPRTIDYKGSDPVAFVRSANWHRRHLSASQRALAQVQLSEWATAGNQPKGAILHPPLTVSQMATTAGVSERSIQHAKQVEESGSAALKAAVKVGDVSISTAAKIAQLPKKDQAAAMEAPPEPQYTPLDAAHDQIGELQTALALVRSALTTLYNHLMSQVLGKSSINNMAQLIMKMSSIAH